PSTPCSATWTRPGRSRRRGRPGRSARPAGSPGFPPGRRGHSRPRPSSERTSMQTTTYPMLTRAERDRRFALARSFMEERGLDAFVFTGGGSRILHYWITNQHYLSNEPEGIVVLPRESEPVLFLARNRWGLVHTDLREGVQPWIEDFRL